MLITVNYSEQSTEREREREREGGETIPRTIAESPKANQRKREGGGRKETENKRFTMFESEMKMREKIVVRAVMLLGLDFQKERERERGRERTKNTAEVTIIVDNRADRST